VNKTGLIKVHSCYSIELGDPLPAVCACNRWIHKHVADRWLEVGLASRVTINGRVVKDQICIVGGSALRTPRAATIDRAHIFRAFVDRDIEEIARIEAYGETNKEFLESITILVDPIEFDKGDREEWGRSILWTFGEDRTAGGIGKYYTDREKK
jgi:hypothetical protein